MIIASAPLRIGLVGGGTDLAAYCDDDNIGITINVAINKYAHVCIEDNFESAYRVSYSNIQEIETDPNNIKNTRARECLLEFNNRINKNIQLISIGDIPAMGSGLGNSSAFSVACCAALLYKASGNTNRAKIAENAINIERIVTNNQNGTQDIASAVYGGCWFRTHTKHSFTNIAQIHEKFVNNLIKYIRLYWIDSKRKGDNLLIEQGEFIKNNYDKVSNMFINMKECAINCMSCYDNDNIDGFIDNMVKGWDLKKTIFGNYSVIFNNTELIQKLKEQDVIGIKGCGSGGGGAVLIVVPPENNKVDTLMEQHGYRKIQYMAEPRGVTTFVAR